MSKIRGKAIRISKHANRVQIEGAGLIPIPFYLMPKIKSGRNYEFTLSYSPFLNCIAIIEVKRVYAGRFIINLVVDNYNKWRISPKRIIATARAK
jgi:hypothetical protein